MRTDRKVVFPAPLGPITAETLECSNLRGNEAWGGWDWWTCKGGGTPVRSAVTAGDQAVDSFPTMVGRAPHKRRSKEAARLNQPQPHLPVTPERMVRPSWSSRPRFRNSMCSRGRMELKALKEPSPLR